MAKGLVYILTNPSLDGWVKIGKTESEDISGRLRSLNQSTALPLSFRCYATYAVENPGDVERRIHNVLDLANYSLRAREIQSNGRMRVREFFKIAPETAYGILREIAELCGDVDKLKPYEPTQEEAQEEADTTVSRRRRNTTFKMLNIPIGETICFQFAENLEAIVLDSVNRVEYAGDDYSISALAVKLLKEKCGWHNTDYADGWTYFTWNGVALSEWRDRLDKKEEIVDELPPETEQC